ncbi:MAG: glycosyltransferase [Proteobacteria bacterium]|nr:glycosyltransferase [Pseudomonadota bacterium]
MIAYHFPPYRGSSGLQRTLRFAQHLPRFGWQPVVLSVHPRAYEATGASAGNEVPAGLAIYRAFGLDAARQLSLFGRYPAQLALPDRWASWHWWAVPMALRIIRRHGCAAIWSTFPIATAHRIGLEVAQRSGLPWIAEFRDPMWQADWPPEPRANAAWVVLEKQIFARADRAVFTAPSSVDIYAARFPRFGLDRMSVIENGYDEETFARAEQAAGGRERAALAPRDAAQTSRRVTILHSGIIYRSERDPTQLFAALASLKRRGVVTADRLRLVLRASGPEVDFAAQLARLDIADIVAVEPALDYIAALQEMLGVDGLLLLQAANCNMQIPAKLYEYLRARRPILALTDPAGDTARTLERAGVGLVAPLDSQQQIEVALLRFLEQIDSGTAPVLAAQAVGQYSREAGAGRLAGLLDSLVTPE